MTSIGDYAFDNCTLLTSITMPDGVTSIDESAFENCTALTSVTIPDSVTSIGKNAFIFCYSLKTITIPASVTSIGVEAFWNCRKLTISGYTGTFAETYAKENDIPFKAIEQSAATLAGDLNADGTVNLKDAVLLRRYIAGGWNVDLVETTAGINKDGTVNLKDVVLLRRFIAGGWGVTL